MYKRQTGPTFIAVIYIRIHIAPAMRTRKSRRTAKEKLGAHGRRCALYDSEATNTEVGESSEKKSDRYISLLSQVWFRNNSSPRLAASICVRSG